MVKGHSSSFRAMVATSRPAVPQAFLGLVACMLALSLGAGCGRGNTNVAPVTGLVTYDGAPVPRGMVVFYPSEGRPALGKIQPDGSYCLTTIRAEDGAIIGVHRVTIESTLASEAPGPSSFEEESNSGLSFGAMVPTTTQWLVPQQYSTLATSPLTATVDPGRNRIDFRLPKDKDRTANGTSTGVSRRVIGGRVARRVALKPSVVRAHMQMQMTVESGAEAVQERDGADAWELVVSRGR